MLEPGELITAVELPPLAVAGAVALPQGARPRVVRVRARLGRRRRSTSPDGDGRATCRIALGGVAHAPWRATRAEEALRGAPATEERFAAAAEAELAQAEPLRDNAFKVPLARNLIVRTLLDLTGGGR